MAELFREANGNCPYCNSGNINIIEGMVFDYIAKDGTPEILREEQYRVSAYCRNCCKQLFPLPNGNGGYTMFPIFVKPIYVLHRNNDPEFNFNRISVLGGKLLDTISTEVNPFTNVREYLQEHTPQEEQPDEDGLIADCVPW